MILSFGKPKKSFKSVPLEILKGNPVVGLALPKALVDEIGFETRKHHLKYDLFFLSRAVYLYRLFGQSKAPLKYKQGFEVVTEESEFVHSVFAFSSEAFARLFKQLVLPVNIIVGHSSFGQFYESTRKDFTRRIVKKGYLIDRGFAAPDDSVTGKLRDLYGKRWTLPLSLREAVDEHAPEDRPPAFVLTARPPDDSLLEGPYVAVMAYLEQWVAHEYQLHQAFTHSVVRTKIERQKGAAAPYLSWQNQQAGTGQSGERHISIGAYRKAETLHHNKNVRDRRACVVPFVVADIDGENLEVSLNVAHLLLKRLDELAVDLNQISASYSGNRSIHIRIPMGMLGNPIFRNTSLAKSILQEFLSSLWKQITEDGSHTPLLDMNLASPLHTIRAIGSAHPATGLHCVGFTGAELYQMGINTTVAYSEHYSPYTLPDPSQAAVVPSLVELLEASAQASNAKKKTPHHSSSGVIARIKEGVARSEEFFPGHVGRNKAAFLYSLYLLDRKSDVQAWDELQKWNKLNDPPIGSHHTDRADELEQVFLSAARYKK